MVSAEHYAKEWARNRNWMLDRLGEVIVLPGIPLSSSGISERCAIRGMIDIAAWFDSLPDPELKLLRNTRKGWEDTYLGKVRRGAGWSDYRLNLMKPVSLNQEAGFIPSTSGEQYWIGKIVLELNREVGLGLATAWSVGRTMSAVRRQAEAVQMGRVIAIGASNAGYTAAALESKGIRTVSASTPGWRITRGNVEDVLKRVKEVYREGDILLIQCLENSIFLCSTVKQVAWNYRTRMKPTVFSM